MKHFNILVALTLVITAALSAFAADQEKDSFCSQAKEIAQNQEVQRHFSKQINMLTRVCEENTALFQHWKTQHAAKRLQLVQIKMSEIKQTKNLNTAVEENRSILDLADMTAKTTTISANLGILRDQTLSAAAQMKTSMAQQYENVANIRVDCSHIGYSGKEALVECQRAVRPVGQFKEALKKHMRDTGMPNFPGNQVSLAEQEIVKSFGALDSRGDTLKTAKHAGALRDFAEQQRDSNASNVSQSGESTISGEPFDGSSASAPKSQADLTPLEKDIQKAAGNVQLPENGGEKGKAGEKYGFIKSLLDEEGENTKAKDPDDVAWNPFKKNGLGSGSVDDAKNDLDLRDKYNRYQEDQMTNGSNVKPYEEWKREQLQKRNETQKTALLEELRQENNAQVAEAMRKPINERTPEEQKMVQEWREANTYASSGGVMTDAQNAPDKAKLYSDFHAAKTSSDKCLIIGCGAEKRKAEAAARKAINEIYTDYTYNGYKSTGLQPAQAQELLSAAKASGSKELIEKAELIDIGSRNIPPPSNDGPAPASTDNANSGMIRCILTDSKGVIISSAKMSPEQCAEINSNYKLKK